MKTLLMIDPTLGQAQAYLVKRILGAAGVRNGIEWVDVPQDAELIIPLDKLPLRERS